jgi:hypothetical protein
VGRVAVVGAALILAMSSFGWYYLPGSIVYFWIHQRHFEHVARFIASQSLPPDEVALFTDGDPVPTRGGPKWDLTGQISAMRTGDGNLAVMILTRDLHHAGMFGYLFSERAPSQKELGPDSWSGSHESFGIPGDREWFVSKRLSSQWWSVYNDLD